MRSSFRLQAPPTQPELLNGSLRHNLDVFDQYDDTALNDALRAAGLFSVQLVGDQNRITLDSEVTSGGRNFSLGQRQIIALARAIVRQSKLLILDEATSAIGLSLSYVRCQALIIKQTTRPMLSFKPLFVQH